MLVIGLLTWNREVQIPYVLDQILKLESPYPIGLVIVDNESEDNTYKIIVDWIRRNKTKFTYIELYRHRCKIPVARNIVLDTARKLKAKRLLYVDDDVLVHPKLVVEAENVFADEPKVAVVASTTYTHYGKTPVYPEQLEVDLGVLPEVQKIVTSWMGSTIINLERLPRHIVFDESKVVLEDIDFMMKVANCGLEIARLNHIKSVHWKLHEDDTSYVRTVKLWGGGVTIRPKPLTIGRVTIRGER